MKHGTEQKKRGVTKTWVGDRKDAPKNKRHDPRARKNGTFARPNLRSVDRASTITETNARQLRAALLHALNRAVSEVQAAYIFESDEVWGALIDAAEALGEIRGHRNALHDLIEGGALR